MGLRSTYDLVKKSSFQMKLILILSGTHTLATSHCLVRILVQRHNWAVFSSKISKERPLQSNDRYRAMLNEFLLTKIKEENIGNIWFQEDGPTCHTAEATLDVLRLEDRVISRSADVVWPL